MKFLPKNTLAYFNAAPQLKRHDLSTLATSVLSQATKKYREDCGMTHPEQDAITFYALNHLAATVKKRYTPNEPLPEWAQKVMDEYLIACSGQGNRMLHYILSICTREMRHLHDNLVSASFWSTLKDQYSVDMADFIKHICTKNESSAVEAYMTNPPKVELGKYIAGLAYAFHKGKWSQGYGGPKWGVVADAASEMIYGKTSMEMLVDTGYTLAHNGGPIFNKGMMYHGYSHSLITILDVQRSGQIPELVLDPLNVNIVSIPSLKTLVLSVVNALPDEFRGWVDWYQVEPIDGQKDKYQMYKTKQVKAHPPGAQKKAAKTVKGKKIVITGEYQVFPGQVVEVFERVTS